ncbi:hypothetical protein T439DRAFT_325601 [Meredithblackwellia eburnea MCA 4105]
MNYEVLANASTDALSIRLGQAISPSPAFSRGHKPSPSLTSSQNAFINLPPHLHHMLLPPRNATPDPAELSFIPSRVAPPVPREQEPFSSPRRLFRRSISSDGTTQLAVALDARLAAHQQQQQKKEGSSEIPSSASSTYVAFHSHRPGLESQESNNRSLPAPVRRKREASGGGSFSGGGHQRGHSGSEESPASSVPSSPEATFSPPPATAPLSSAGGLPGQKLLRRLDTTGLGLGVGVGGAAAAIAGMHDPTASPTLGKRTLASYFEQPTLLSASPLRGAGVGESGGSQEDGLGAPLATPLSATSRVSASPSSGSAGEASMLNLDEEGASFHDLFIRPPPLSSTSPNKVRDSVSSYASTILLDEPEDVTATFTQFEEQDSPSHTSLYPRQSTSGPLNLNESTGLTFGIVTHSPVVFSPGSVLTNPNDYDINPHLVEPDTPTDVRASTFTTDTQRELDALFSRTIETVQTHGTDLDRRDELESDAYSTAAVSEDWATAEEGDTGVEDSDAEEGHDVHMLGDLDIDRQRGLHDLSLDFGQPFLDEQETPIALQSGFQNESPQAISSTPFPDSPTLSHQFVELTPIIATFAEGEQARNRPRSTPSQGTWASTSFGLDVFGEPLPSPQANSSAPGSHTSFLDFTGAQESADKPVSAPARMSSFLDLGAPDEGTTIDSGTAPRALTAQSSNGSFLDDWSPPCSPTISPIELPGEVRVENADGESDRDKVASLNPSSPTASTHHHRSEILTVGEGTRDSLLSVESAAYRNSRVSHGSFSGSAFSGILSNASHTSLIRRFPDPPENEEGDTISTIPIPPVPLEEHRRSLLAVPSTSTLRPRRSRSLPSLADSSVSTSTSNWTVESTDEEDAGGGVRRETNTSGDQEVIEDAIQPNTPSRDTANRPFSMASLLDSVAAPLDVDPAGSRPRSLAPTVSSRYSTETRRWSGTSWISFFSGGALPAETRPPLPASTTEPRERLSRHERTPSDPSVYHNLHQGRETPEERW